MTRTRTLLRGVLAATLVGGLTLAAAPQDTRSPYVEDPDPLVRQKIDEWQDLKLGLLMHWGTYSQWGIVESWSLCSEDEPWCRRSMDDYATYKTAYEKLQTTFNPVRFDPERWANAARDAGMRYVVFTTKHHDGFSIYRSKVSDYDMEITPYKGDPLKQLTDAAKKKIWTDRARERQNQLNKEFPNSPHQKGS